MPLVRGTAYVTAAQVAEITHEAGLERLDEGSATIANACIRATDYVIDDLKASRGIDPAKVSNTGDLIVALANCAAWICLDAQPDDESQARAAKRLAAYEKALAKYQFESTDSGDEQFQALPMPRTYHLDKRAACSHAPPTFDPDSDATPRTYVQK